MDEVVLDPKFPDKVVQTVSDLPDEVRADIIAFLCANVIALLGSMMT